VQLSKDNSNHDETTGRVNFNLNLNASESAKRLSLSKQIEELSQMNRKIEQQNAS